MQTGFGLTSFRSWVRSTREHISSLLPSLVSECLLQMDNCSSIYINIEEGLLTSRHTKYMTVKSNLNFNLETPLHLMFGVMCFHGQNWVFIYWPSKNVNILKFLIYIQIRDWAIESKVSSVQSLNSQIWIYKAGLKLLWKPSNIKSRI